MNPEDVPDEYFSDLRDDVEEFDLHTMEEVEGEIRETEQMMCVWGAAAMLAKLFRDDKITFREYVELAEHIEEHERELDATLR